MAGRKKVDRKYGEKFAGREVMHDTMDKLEALARSLRIRQSHGGGYVDDPLEVVAFWLGDAWNKIYRQYENGIDTDEEFYVQAVMLINRYADAHSIPRPQVAA